MKNKKCINCCHCKDTTEVGFGKCEKWKIRILKLNEPFYDNCFVDKNKVFEDEKFISDCLVDIWNKFVSLEQTHPSDIEDFKRGVHDLQKVIGMRELRRFMPEKYPCK